MSSGSESDFENNTCETNEGDEVPSVNELSNSLRERFSNILPYQFEPVKILETLWIMSDQYQSIMVRTKRLIHMSWIELREITSVFVTNVVKKREKLIACVAVM